MITAKPLFVLILVSGLEPSEPVGEPFMQNLLTEYEVLSEACDSLAQAELRTTEQAVGVLETKEADDMEEIISSAKFNLCAVKDKTGFVREKLVRLMNNAIYNKCLVDKQCSAMMPALDGIEEHFYSRSVKFEQALLSAKDLEKLLPANLVWMKSYSATLQLISDVYDMFSQFITPTVLGVWLVGNTPIQMPVLIMFLSLFLAFIIWKKVMALSFLLILVLCFMHLPRAIQYQKLHQDTMETVANIQKLKITTDMNDVKEFQTIAAYRDLKNVKDVATKAIDVFKATVPNYSNHVRMLQKVGYSELADVSQEVFEQFHKYITSLKKIMVKSRDFFDYVKRTFEVLLEMKGVKLMELKRFVKGILDDSIEIEAMYEGHRNTFLGLIGKLNSLKQDAKKIEQANIENMASIKNLAKWLTMGGLVLATTGGVGLAIGGVGLAGAGGIGGVGGVGLAGAKYYENEVDTIEKKNIVLHDFQDIALVYREYTKKINDVLHEMDASKLRSALIDINKAASDQNIDHEDLEYFFGEVSVMAKENLAEVEKVVRGLKAISS